MNFFVTGAAGFIGSNLVDRLLADGHTVIGYDNLSTGFIKFITSALKYDGFELISGDLLDIQELTKSMKGCDFVFHFAANADVRSGLDHPYKDLEQNTIATFNVLEAMRANSIGKIAFSSTGAMYGEPKIFPTPEDAPLPVQTSLYGSSKLACEGLISAYCEGYDFQSWIFRFVSVMGERYTHGHVFDFYKQLVTHPDSLYVLGNGKQKKSSMYVQDCISAMFLAVDKAKDKVNIFNLGTDGYCEVNDSIRWITEHLGLNPLVTYSGGERGWVGDSPFIYLDTKKIRKLGWEPKMTIQDGILITVDWLKDNHWVLEKR